MMICDGISMTLGSLFDGIGGWPLAAVRAGIKPVWASEIDPFPKSVTAKHFPDMKQLGDIKNIDGGEIEPVDIICAGSPCQDLSIAGKREGLQGERSGLFKRAIDIVRDMRRATDRKYPRWLIWENVPGAFSSNHGNDFRTVLEAVAETEVPMPRSGRWANAGMVRSNTCDIAWRVLDAQYWGVPQRRKRIFLVADFAGQSARKILFEPQSVHGNPAEGRTARENIAGSVKKGSRDAVVTHVLNDQGGVSMSVSEGVSGTLRAGMNGHPPVIYDMSHPCDVIRELKDGIVPVMKARMGTGENNVYLTLQGFGEYENTGISSTVKSRDYKDATDLILDEVYSIAGNVIGRNRKNGGNGIGVSKNVSYTLTSRDKHAVSNAHMKARRLTPLECERLQGLPDGWTDGGSDTQRYKAIGNGMAQPCADWILMRIAEMGVGK